MAATGITCDCGVTHAPGLLSCPGCQRLTHDARLRELAARAKSQQDGGDVHAALVTWREALDLLPADSTQHRQVSERIQALSDRARDLPTPADPREKEATHGAGKWAAVGTLGLLLWKFKVVILGVLGKAKWLLLGLSKGKTLFSMLAFAGVYWSLFGWWFAIGLVIGIYIHEMGHVAALKRLGIAASAPMFIPGVGAFVRMKQYPATPSEDAQVGLAGPIWGAAASFGFYLLHLLWGAPELAAITRFNAWINLFNLLPFGPLDGGRGMNAMGRRQRWICVAALGVSFLANRDGLLLLLILLGVYRAAMTAPAPEPDGRATLTYVGLVLVLTALSQVPVPGVPS